MENGISSEVRILFVVLNAEGWAASAQELMAGEWVSVNPDTYYDVPDDLYLSESDEGRAWGDGWGFTAPAQVVPGEAPSAEEAEATVRAYLEHRRSEDDEEAELEGVVLVFDADSLSE